MLSAADKQDRPMQLTENHPPHFQLANEEDARAHAPS